MREACLLKGLVHPNVNPILAACIDDDHCPLLVFPFVNQGNLKKFLQRCKLSEIGSHQVRAGLDIGLGGPVARGASRFENLLAPQKTYWPGGPVDLKTYWPPKKLTGPPKKLTGPYLQTKLARRKTICINLQFAHRPIIKLFRSHPRNIFQI